MVPPSRKCFLCLKTLRTRREDDKSNQSKLKDQLTTAFLVFKILKVPNTKCKDFLRKKGNPSDWFDFCSICKNLCKDSENTSKEIARLKKKLIELKEKIEQHVLEGHKILKTPKSSRFKKFNLCQIVREEVAERLHHGYPIHETPEETYDANVAVKFESAVEVKTEPEEYENVVDLDSNFQPTTPEPEQTFDNGDENEADNYDDDDELQNDDEELQNDDEVLENDDEELQNDDGVLENDDEKPQNCNKALLENKVGKEDLLCAPYVVAEKVDGGYTCRYCGKLFRVLGKSYEKHCLSCRSVKLPLEVTEARKTRSGNRYKYALSKEDLEKVSREFYGRSVPVVPIKKNYRKEGEFDENYTHECKTCKNKYESSVALYRHYLLIHGEEFWVPENELVFPCSDCCEKFSNEGLLAAHIRTKHNGKEIPFRCKICKKFLKTYPGFIQHCEKRHTKDGPVKCSQCSLHCYNDSFLQIHIWQVHDGDKRPYKCSVCLRSFGSEIKMRFHRQIHFGDKEFMCEFCSLEFVSTEQLNKHQLKEHCEELGVPLHKCNLCDLQFGDYGLFKDHINTSHAEKKNYPFSCTICKRGRFEKEDKLKAHMIEYHAVEKKFPCTQCSRRFRMNKQLTRHMLKEHSDNYQKKIYKCQHCDETFPKYDKLRNHLAKRHDQKPFQCSHCGKRFGFTARLKRHLKNLHGVVDFNVTTEPQKNSDTQLKANVPSDSSSFQKRKTKNVETNRGPSDCFLTNEIGSDINVPFPTTSILPPSMFMHQSDLITFHQTNSLFTPGFSAQF